MAKSKTERGRFASRKKMDVVLRVRRGGDLDRVSREAGITAAKVSEWRDQFVAKRATCFEALEPIRQGGAPAVRGRLRGGCVPISVEIGFSPHLL